MLNFLKSKTAKVAVGFIVALAIVGAVKTAPAHAANYNFQTNLTVGMTNADVMTLQQFLNANGYTVSTSGAGSAGMESMYFGTKTKAALAAFQAAKGISPAAGYFGPITRGVINAMAMGGSMGTWPAGCTSASGYSSTTGMPCSGGSMNLPAGCTSTAGFSSTTGVSCSSNTTTTNTSGSEGYLADSALDSSGRVTTVYESESDKVVAGFRMTARLADQTVERVQVQMDQAGSGSANLAKYASSVSLWYGSTKVATMSVADASRNTSTDVYTFNFTGLSSKIMKDQIGRFYVSVNANGSIDTNDALQNWGVYFPTAFVRASSPNSVYQTYDLGSAQSVSVGATSFGASYAYNFNFGKFSTNGLKATIGLDTTNPAAGTVAVSTTAATNGVRLLTFTVKATNSDLHLRKIPIQISSTTANVSAIINTVYLMNGSNTVDTADGSAGVAIASSVITSGACTTSCGFFFSNLAAPYDLIPSGSTATFSIVVDLKSQTSGPFSDGDTLTASLANGDALLTANFSVQDANGDQLTAGSTYRVGSAVGNVQTLRVNGVNVVMGNETITPVTDQSGNTTQLTYVIPVSVTSFGNTLYLGQSVQLAAAATASNAFAYVFQNSSAPTTSDVAASVSATFSTSDATLEGNGFRLDSGTTKHFTLTVNLVAPTTNSNSYRVALKQIKTFTDSNLGAGASTQTLLPVEAFQTDYHFITS